MRIQFQRSDTFQIDVFLESTVYVLDIEPFMIFAIKTRAQLK